MLATYNSVRTLSTVFIIKLNTLLPVTKEDLTAIK